MLNRKIEITKENESILFINAVIENLRYAIISLDAIFSRVVDYNTYCDEHTFFFFHANTKEECEEKLAEMIAKIKAEITAEKERLNAKQTA